MMCVCFLFLFSMGLNESRLINYSSFRIGLRILTSVEEYDWGEHMDICQQMDQ